MLLLAPLIVGGLAGCRPALEPPELPKDYPHAVVALTCGAAGGEALAFYLTPAVLETPQPSSPYVHIYLGADPELLVGRTWTWPGLDIIGSAGKCDAAGRCANVVSGTVTLDRFEADSTLPFSVDLTFPEGARVLGSVRGKWRPPQAPLRCI